jgi:Transcriptional regulator
VEKTVVKALQVLEALADSDRPRGVSELARELGLSKSNATGSSRPCARRATSVESTGEQSFELSLKMWHLGSKVTARLDIKATAASYLRELRDKTRETARLTVLHGDQGICIEQAETKLPMRIQTPIGGALLLYCSSTGKAMLAFQSRAFIDDVASSIVKFTPMTITGRRKLLAELEQIRRDGYAINRGERVAGVCGVAAPVTNSAGDVRAAIGISGPAERLKPRTLAGLGRVVREIAARLSHDLGAPNA